MAWQEIPLGKLFLNIKEAALTRASAAVENCYQNEAGGFSRFPGMDTFLDFGGVAPVYLFDWRDDLIAVTGHGKFYRITPEGVAEDCTGVVISGGKRPVFDKTTNELVVAAGAQIIAFAGDQTEILSDDAPLSTHVQYLDGYLIAAEAGSGRFFHSDPLDYRVWDPLSVFTAEAKPDNINSLMVTPFRELIIGGVDSTEQYERLASGDTPFFRRWAVGDGVLEPYSMTFADNSTWALNRDREFVRFSGQITQSAGDDIGATLEGIDDISDAWAAPILTQGQKFILLQLPNATNIYDTKGITLLYDYRQKKWNSLFGWDADVGVPAAWPGVSHHQLWGRHFIGGAGKIYELKGTVYQNAGQTQRVLIRTAHFDQAGEVRIDNVRLRVKRGVGSHTVDPAIRLRVTRDNSRTTVWRSKGLGLTGDTYQNIEFGGMGIGHSFQVEIDMTDAAEFELVKAWVDIQKVGW